MADVIPTGQERATIVRRAVRVAVAAGAGFYPLLYGAGLPVTALYALFAPIAVGLLSPVPGSGRQRASAMVRALPPALALATLGTLLAVDTWAAVGGMLVVGFLPAFAAVGGPRPAGVGPGLQLFYILACFPPYAPDTLGQRLSGLTIGILLLTALELLLPDPPATPYRERIARALDEAARGTAAGGVRPERLREAGARLRLSAVPPAERPAGAGRRDRALEQSGRAVRRLLDQLATLAETSPTGIDPASAALLGRVSRLCTTSARFLRTGEDPPVPGALEAAMRDFQAGRVRQASAAPGERPPAEVERRHSRVLALAESARMVEITTDIAVHGRPTEPALPRRLFWYADLSTPRLWARRVVGNATFRSVLFQNAVRTALGLAAARAVAGSLDLSHGFWVLLVVLTLGRTTAGATWQAVRQAVAGNAAGALVAGALLIGLGPHTDVYAALLAPVMLVAFALGPLLGIAYAQGLFTLVVAAAFAQIEPVTWRLSEARMIDVVTGSVIGLLCGLLAWPAGARSEVHRAMADLLRTCAELVPGTAEALLRGSGAVAGDAPGTPVRGEQAAPRTLPGVHKLRLAEAAYAQYRTETPAEDTRADWHAMLIAANHMLLGAHYLPRFGLRSPADATDASAAWARTTARGAVAEVDRIAVLLAGGTPEPVRRRTSADSRPPTPLSVDLEVWLESLDQQLTRIDASLTPAAQPPPPVTPSGRRTAPPG
ncbi:MULTISPECIES: FUSC family protein [unclassified Streptomyces]|uniref:FUSC family protein n=1 Tax=unclassified Streptomyces TaxID=2593676 RepID=UPI000FDACFF5|nr:MULTISPECIES: FUSC family protein [unclassified Streptomyces]UQA32404.1 FUSC family protein [Streptomyces sp. HNA39]